MIKKIETKVMKDPKTKLMVEIPAMMVDLEDHMVAMILVKDREEEMIAIQKKDH